MTPVGRFVKKARGAGAVLAAVLAAKKMCKSGEAEALLAGIPDFETKNAGGDLNGWAPGSVVSSASGETHHFYHLAPRAPNLPTMVLVHGLFLDGRSFLRFNELAEHFELFALELPHESPFYKGQLTDFTDLLQDFVDAIERERIHLLGVSLGGMIAMKYAGQDPRTTLDGLYLIATGTPVTDADLDRQRRAARRVLKMTGDRDEMAVCLIDALKRRKMKTASSEEREVMALFTLKHPAFYRQVLYAAVSNDTLLPVRRIGVPTLIIHGDRDKTIPYERSGRLVEVIPDAACEIIAGGRHDIAYSRANEVVSSIVRHHLRLSAGK